MVTKRVNKSKTPGVSKRKPPERGSLLWIAWLGEQIPPEERARLPKDGARNLDKYLYGPGSRS